ncbi:MAG TPA: ATP-binding protein [Bacilli bacterium]|nr:ATP-binding protein [Bacilli bacterium]
MIRGIRKRIVLTYLVLILLALSIFGVYMLSFIERLYMDNFNEHLREETTLLAEWITPRIEMKTRAEQKEVYELTRHTALTIGGRVTIIAADGHVLVDTMSDAETVSNQLDDPEVATALYDGVVGNDIRKTDYATYNVQHFAVPVFHGGGKPVAAVRLAVELEDANLTLKSLWGKIGLSLLIVAVVASLFGLRLAHGIAAPIEAITRSTRKIAEGAFDERVVQRGRDELGVMTDSINAMAARISEQFEDLNQQTGKLEGILKHLVSGVLVVDRSGRITLVNPAVERMVGVRAELLLEKWHWEAGRHFGLSSLIDEAILVGKGRKKEVTLHKPVERTVEVNITPIVTQQDRIAGAVVLLHDVSEFRRLEQMRSEFVANVSHELRTPITAVKGFSETLLDGALDDPEIARQFLQIIYDESERLRRLVNDLLELSKIESGHTVFRYDTIEMKQLVGRTVKKYKHQAETTGLSIVTELPDHDIFLQADEDRVSQVLINLLGNAIAYTPEGEVVVSVYETEEHGVLEVRDTGIGIPPEDLPRLFERFYRVDKARARRSGGTGLGLAIVKHIIEGHGGRVEVESEVGTGSTFRIFLPKFVREQEN